MPNLLYALMAAILVGFISLVGIFSLFLNKNILSKIIFALVALSAGALIGGAFLHLIPEAVEKTEGLSVFIYVLVGFSLFYLIERFLKWHHCHLNPGECEAHHTFRYMNLIGDAIHNFIDGMIIGSSFAVSLEIGLVTTTAVILHEIPQEMGDFGVLIHGGYSRAKALFYNLLISLTAILGVFVVFFLENFITNLDVFLLPFAAGGFIYIAASDLIPELHKETSSKKSILSFGVFILGITLMLAVKMLD